MKIKAVIFDMDGVLIDSEIYWNDVGKIFFESHNIEFTPELQSKIIGVSETEIAEFCQKEFNLNNSIEKIMEERKKLSDEIYFQKAKPLSGINELLDFLYKNNLPMAIASSSSLYRIETIVKKFGWQDYFSKLISAEEFDFPGKPSPEIYLRASMELKIKPDECLVFEDAGNGVKSAKAAGMTCIGIEDKRWVHGDLSSADFIVDSLDDKKIFDFLYL